MKLIKRNRNWRVYGALALIVMTIITLWAIGRGKSTYVEGSTRSYRIGEEVQAGSFKMQVKGYTERSEIKGKKTAHNYFVIQVLVKNAGMEPKTIETDIFKLMSEDGKVYWADEELSKLANNGGFINKQLNPDISSLGYIVFEIPEEAKEKKYFLEMYENDLLGEKVSVEVVE